MYFGPHHRFAEYSVLQILIGMERIFMLRYEDFLVFWFGGGFFMHIGLFFRIYS